MLVKRAAAELVGTFVLVFAGVGTAVISGDKVGIVGIGFAFGLALLVMAYAIGPISGCHINPAVTLGLVVRGKLDVSEAVYYWVGQVLGAVAAAAMLLVIVKARSGGYDPGAEGFGANGYAEHSPGGYPLGAVLLVEVLLTGLLMFTVLAATDRIAEVAFAGLPIGLVLVVIHFVGIPVDNLSVNPARSIAPAIFVGDWALSQLWVFIVAPLAGALLAAGLHGWLFSGARPVDSAESAVTATR